MNTLALLPYTYEKLMLFVLVLTRISTFLATFAMFRQDYVSPRIILGLSSMLTFYALLLFDNKLASLELFSIPMMAQLIFQVLLGFVGGLVLNIIFEIFSAAGQIISTQIGLSMVTLIDPRLGAITPLTLFYNYVAIIIFLLLNGHLTMIDLLLRSFSIIPINYIIIPTDMIMNILKYAAIIFNGGGGLSITIIINIFLTNFNIAVMTRFAPQFNIFSIGLNLTIILGLIFIFLTFDLFVSNGEQYISDGLIYLQNVIYGMKLDGG